MCTCLPLLVLLFHTDFMEDLLNMFISLKVLATVLGIKDHMLCGSHASKCTAVLTAPEAFVVQNVCAGLADLC